MTQLASFSAKVPVGEQAARITTLQLPSGTTILGTSPVVRDGALVVSFKHDDRPAFEFRPLDRSVIVVKDGAAIDAHFVHERTADFLSTVIDEHGTVFHVFAHRHGAFAA